MDDSVGSNVPNTNVDDVVRLSSTTESSQAVLENALSDDPEAGRVPVESHGTLSQYTRSESEDGNTKTLVFEHPKSSRVRAEQSLARAERELAELSLLEPSPKDQANADQVLQDFVRERTQQAEPPRQPAPNMVPATQADIDNLVEQRVSFREHEGRLAQAMQDPAFREAMSRVDLNNVNVSLHPQVATVIASQVNSPQVTWFLAARPDVAQTIASMSVPRAIGEISRLSSWLQTQMSPQNAASARRSPSTPPPPIKPIGGQSAPRDYSDPSIMTFSEYKKWRRETARR
jgi:hypothetical protein